MQVIESDLALIIMMTSCKNQDSEMRDCVNMTMHKSYIHECLQLFATVMSVVEDIGH